MKHIVGISVIFILLTGAFGFAQSVPVGIIELIANPARFDTRVVTVRGFLIIEREPGHGVGALLYLHQEDAQNALLDNSIFVVASDRMIQDMEKINEMYVELTGTVRLLPLGKDRDVAEIKNIQNCVPWSNPRRPVREISGKGK